MGEFGLQSSDVVLDAATWLPLSGVTLECYLTEADAQAQTAKLTDVLVTAGRWTYSNPTLDWLWLRAPDGSVWATEAAGVTSGPPPLPMWSPPFFRTGPLVPTTPPGKFTYTNDTGRTLTVPKVRASVGTTPGGQAVIVDVMKDGVSLWVDPGDRPAIAPGETTVLVVPDVQTLEDGSGLSVYIAQTGSPGTPGEDLIVSPLLAG